MTLTFLCSSFGKFLLIAANHPRILYVGFTYRKSVQAMLPGYADSREHGYILISMEVCFVTDLHLLCFGKMCFIGQKRLIMLSVFSEQMSLENL